MPNEPTTRERPKFIVVKTTVFGREIPMTTKRCETNEFVKILVGSKGTVLAEYVTHEGTTICVAEFDDNVWAWIGATAYERVNF